MVSKWQSPRRPLYRAMATTAHGHDVRPEEEMQSSRYFVFQGKHHHTLFPPLLVMPAFCLPGTKPTLFSLLSA